MKNSEKPSIVSGLAFLGRCVVGGVLVYAGFSKALAPAAEFSAALANYHLFPAVTLAPLAFIVPWLEIWAGLFLIAGLYTFWAALASLLLYASFLSVLASSYLRHIDLVSCGCFGAETLSPAVTFKMDALLMGVAVLLAFFFRRRRDLTLDNTLV